jgi:chromate reductase
VPIYSYDHDDDFPAAFKQAVAVVDAVLFVMPEYNPIPGGLKNAIDWGSRPYGQNSFARKPSAASARRPVRSVPRSPNSSSVAS